MSKTIADELERDFSGRLQDLTGKVFGKLTVKTLSAKKGAIGHAFWLCECECGKQKTVSSSNLKVGNTKSCGCLARSAMKKKWDDIKKDRAELNRLRGLIKDFLDAKSYNDSAEAVRQMEEYIERKT